jgi:hypothetical protein
LVLQGLHQPRFGLALRDLALARVHGRDDETCSSRGGQWCVGAGVGGRSNPQQQPTTSSLRANAPPGSSLSRWYSSKWSAPPPLCMSSACRFWISSCVVSSRRHRQHRDRKARQPGGTQDAPHARKDARGQGHEQARQHPCAHVVLCQPNQPTIRKHDSQYAAHRIIAADTLPPTPAITCLRMRLRLLRSCGTTSICSRSSASRRYLSASPRVSTVSTDASAAPCRMQRKPQPNRRHARTHARIHTFSLAESHTTAVSRPRTVVVQTARLRSWWRRPPRPASACCQPLGAAARTHARTHAATYARSNVEAQ